MSSIGRYIMRTIMGAFLLTVVSLTLLIWTTQAIREIDVVTSQGQTILAFLALTALIIPALVLVIAPIAFVVAAIYSINKLNADSEIAVMNAAGMSPWRIFMPFFVSALCVSLLVAFISAYLSPKCLRELRVLLTQVRANLIANVIQPGRFTALQDGQLTFHIRERRANGELGGIFIDDRRDPQLRATFLAERGMVIDNDTGSFLLLEKGSAQRVSAKEPDPTIVLFERYAFDMSQFAGSTAVPRFNPRERFIWELMWPDVNDPYYQQNTGAFRAELNERITAPMYPIIFALLAFAILGAPRTTRQSRGLSLLMAVVALGLVRVAGFAGVVFINESAGAVYVLHGLLAAVVIGSAIVVSRATVVEPPAFITQAIAAVQARFAPKTAVA
ncbi:MAG: LPS export ABC transporter permease LptF [Rhizobiales bacterium]|nr:LPS export ABC transporter permease LptF [Hyphomicrobiales bacterium]